MVETHSRRSFLKYIGYSAVVGAGAHLLGPLAGTVEVAYGKPLPLSRFTGEDWTPVSYPIPSPGDGGNASADATQFAEYEVRDELILPDGFRYEVLAKWGDRFGPAGTQFVFGTAADFTGLQPVAGTSDEYFLIVNHEYISGRPWLQGYESIYGRSLVDERGRAGKLPLLGCSLDLHNAAIAGTPYIAPVEAICDAAMRDLGISILHVRREADGMFRPIVESDKQFRIWGHGAKGTTADRFSFTGPASALLTSPRGTFANCSGAVAPWGTFLSCEENFQDQVMEFVEPDGQPLRDSVKRFAGLGEDHPTNLPFEFEGLGIGVEPPLDGRQYGWVVEVDPVRRTLKKHTALGRFRHENVALRVEAGKPLAAYMGDDRRGGHVWKFVSSEVVKDPADPNNSDLLSHGTLYVSRWKENYTGEWIPLRTTSPLVRPEPEHTSLGQVWLPARPAGGHVAVGETREGSPAISLDKWISSVESYTGKAFDSLTLSDLVKSAGVIEMDAYVMGNSAGGTPCSRPEDIEVHPQDQSVYIAFTDSTGSGDGSPDVRIFPDSKGVNSRQYGAIYRIAEVDNDPASTEFTWGHFVAAGETYEGGGGFACADNMVFDPDGNLWMVCDITTPKHNFPVTRAESDKTNPGNAGFMGIFGNNAMFMIPTRGEQAGIPLCFAIGPMECEMTGPTFSADGRTLIVSVQHPGELHGTRAATESAGKNHEIRTMELTTRAGTRFKQRRNVPLGSNFPGQPGSVPLSAVVCITRTRA